MTKKHIVPVSYTQRNISLVALGIGLTLFLINISGMLSELPLKYDAVAFDLSIFSAIFIIIYAVYNLHKIKE